MSYQIWKLYTYDSNPNLFSKDFFSLKLDKTTTARGTKVIISSKGVIQLYYHLLSLMTFMIPYYPLTFFWSVILEKTWIFL